MAKMNNIIEEQIQRRNENKDKTVAAREKHDWKIGNTAEKQKKYCRKTEKKWHYNENETRPEDRAKL